MTFDQTTRPSFYEGQYLGSDDLSAIVDYGHTQFARHILGAHAWGIAAGLQLIENPSPSGGSQVQMFIQPGYAWDGFGRSIVVLVPVQISEALFQGFGTKSGQPNGYPLKIWLQYQEVGGLAAPPGFAQCDSTGYSRVQETYQIVIGDQPDLRDPVAYAGYSVDASLTAAALDPTSTTVIADASVPDQIFPDPVNGPTWLIPLGYVLWLPASGSQPGMFISRTGSVNVPADSAFRINVGVIAGSVLAAENSIQMRKRTDPLPIVLSDDLVWVEGDIRISGDTREFGGALKFLTATGDGDPGPVAPLCPLPSTPNVPGTNKLPPLMINREDCASGSSYLEIVIGQGTAGKFSGLSSLQIGPLDPSGNLLSMVTVLDSGNVGIGTTSPPVPLSFPATTGDKIALWQQAGDANYYGFGIAASLMQVYSDVSASDIAFGTGGSSKNFIENVRITGKGNVGIGNTKPPVALSFGANAGDLVSLYSPNYPNYFGFGVDKANNILQIYCDQAASSIALGTGSSSMFTELIRVSGSGLIGINNSKPRFPISFPDQLGDKIALWGQNPSGHYGFGIQSSVLQIHTDGAGSDVAFGFGGSGTAGAFTETMRIRGNGTLDVNGDIQISNGLSVPASPEKLTLIRGTVNFDGSIAQGTGFTINHWDTGHYIVNFSTPFSNTPSGAVTQVFFDTAEGGSTLDNAVIIEMGSSFVSLQTGDSNGIKSDRGFTFLFAGPR